MDASRRFQMVINGVFMIVSIINHPVKLMLVIHWHTTYENGGILGMDYDCFTHINSIGFQYPRNKSIIIRPCPSQSAAALPSCHPRWPPQVVSRAVGRAVGRWPQQAQVEKPRNDRNGDLRNGGSPRFVFWFSNFVWFLLFSFQVQKSLELTIEENINLL